MPRASRCALLVTLALSAGAAAAQTVYRCQDAAGKTVMSDRPCDTSTTPAGVVATAPAMGPRWNGPSRPPGAPEHYEYLSGSCRSLNDAIRGARAQRTTSWQNLRRLEQEYQERCRDDEADAYKALWEQKQAAQKERSAAKKAEVVAAQQVRTEKQLCQDMAQLLAAKRARTDLSEAERAELQRFLDNHRARCAP